MKLFFKILTTIVVITLSTKSYASTTNKIFNRTTLVSKKKVPKEEKKLLDAARKDLAKEDYETAKIKYLQLVELDPNNKIYNYETGLCFYFSIFERSKSIIYFEKALKCTDSEEIPELKYYLGRAYHINSQYEKSKVTLSEFEQQIQEHKEGQYLLKETKYRIHLDENGIDLLKEKDNNVIIKNLGDGLNTINREYAPVSKNNEKVIIFTSRREGSTGGKLAHDLLPYEDIYVAKEISSGKWSLIEDSKELEKYLPNGFNTRKHNAGVVYSVDEKTLYLYKEDMLWKSEFVDGKWGELEKLGDDVNESKLNIPSATISADGNTVYFVATRKDGLGGEDIYIIKKDTTNDTWNKPVNLGAEINTEFDEDAPFLSKDGTVFYFSSKGHEGLGGFDMYRSDIVNGVLSKPINLGIPMNSPVDDIYLVIDEKNEVGFFSSDREGGKGDMDIYAFDISCPNIENTEIRGIVYDKTNDVILQGDLNLLDTNGTKLFEAFSLTNNGKFLITTAPDNTYQLVIDVDGYQEQTLNITIPKQCEFFPIFIEVSLERFMVGDEFEQIATANISSFKAEPVIAAALADGIIVDTDALAKEVPLVKDLNDNHYESDKQLMAFTRTIDPNATNLNYVVVSDTITYDPIAARLLAATKSYQQEFDYNIIKINTADSVYNKMIDDAIKRLNLTGKNIIVNIESSASKVPTTTYKTNINLASLRGDEARDIVMKTFKDKGISEDKIEVNAINSIISGPEYNKDFKNKDKYKPYQYVKVTIE